MVLQATLLCLVLVSSSPIAGGTVFTPEQTTLLQEFVETLMQCRGITGLTLAVVRGNDTWTKGFGVADKESGRNVSSSTLFGIGSVTKAFTSAILSLFINETGRLVFCTYFFFLLPALPELLLLLLLLPPPPSPSPPSPPCLPIPPQSFPSPASFLSSLFLPSYSCCFC